MEKVSEVLTRYQLNGKLTTLHQLARALEKDHAATTRALLTAIEFGEFSLAYWPEYGPTCNLFIHPSAKVLEEMKLTLDEVVWPQLTNGLLTSNFAARIYVYNTFMGFQKGAPRDESWTEQMGYLYRNLALTAFGPSEDWTEKDSLLVDLPTTEGLLTPVEKKEKGKRKALAPICRVCGKPLEGANSSIRGIDPRCWAEAVRTGILTTAEQADPAGISDERLNEVLQKLQPVRPRYTEEEAKEKYPEGYVALGSVIEKALTMGISVSRIAKAIGGDRGIGPVHSENWKQFLIRRNRYLSARAMEELEELKK